MAEEDQQSETPPTEESGQGKNSSKKTKSGIGDLWKELQRRSVIKVCLAYLAFAWLLIQVASIIFTSFGGPDWPTQALIIAFTVGFPIVAILTWSYEWTSEGIQLDENEVLPESMKRVHGRKLDFAIIAFLLLAVSALVVDRFISSKVDEPIFTSIAVLPFENLSGDLDKEYFTDGMTDTLITKLSQITSLRVRARMSVMKFKNSDQGLSKIAAALGVKVILAGSAIYDQGRVRITTQLINAVTDEHLWAESYDRDLEDILALHSEVALNVAKAVALIMSPEEESRLLVTRKVNRESYEAFLRGKYYVNTYTLDGFEKGIGYFNEAVERDPADPLAWAGLAYGHVAILHSPIAWAGASAKKAEAAALRALDLDPELAEAWSALADVKSYFLGDYLGAERAFLRANELNPSLAMNHFHYAWYLALMGRVDEAIVEHEKAEELDPLTSFHAAYTGSLYLYLGEYDQALAKVAAAALNPDDFVVLFVQGLVYRHKGMLDEAIAAHERLAQIQPLAQWILGVTYALAGRTDEALEMIPKLEQASMGPTKGWAQYGLAVLHIALGNKDEAVHWLSQKPGHAWRSWLLHDAYVVSLLKDHPGYIELVREKPLPEGVVPNKYSFNFPSKKH